MLSLERYIKLSTFVSKFGKRRLGQTCIAGKTISLADAKVERTLSQNGINSDTYLITYSSPIGWPIHLAAKVLPWANANVLSEMNDGSRNPFMYLTLVEISMMNLATQLVTQDCLPNLPVFYGLGLCDSCELSSKFEEYENNQACMVMLSELASLGDMQTWFQLQRRSAQEWRAALAQIYAALYFMQTHFLFYHCDLHWGNVLVHSLKTSILGSDTSHNDLYLIYKLKGKLYCVPTNGNLFTLWDMGYAVLYKRSTMNHLTDTEKQNLVVLDYFRIAGAAGWLDIPDLGGESAGYDAEKMQIYYRLRSMANNKKDISYVFENLFNDYQISQKEVERFPMASVYGVYDLDKTPSVLAPEHQALLNMKMESPVIPNNPALPTFDQLADIASVAGSDTKFFQSSLRELEKSMS